MYLLLNRKTPLGTYSTRNWIVVYPTLEAAKGHPFGHLEGDIDAFAKYESKRQQIQIEVVRNNELIVAVEIVDKIFARVITQTGFVGWALTEEPAKSCFEDDDEEWW